MGDSHLKNEVDNIMIINYIITTNCGYRRLLKWYKNVSILKTGLHTSGGDFI